MLFPGIKHYLCVFMLQGSGAGGFGTYRERDEIWGCHSVHQTVSIHYS